MATWYVEKPDEWPQDMTDWFDLSESSTKSESSTNSTGLQDIIQECLTDDLITGHYTDIQKIGEGGFGSVYKVTHSLDGCDYALKFVPVNSSALDKKEVEALAKLDHVNIVRYYTSHLILCKSKGSRKAFKSDSDGSLVSFRNSESEESGNIEVEVEENCKSSDKSQLYTFNACIVVKTELCNTQQNLQHLIEDKSIFNETFRQQFLLDILSGLKYIHDEGYMHRDLKPPNILVGMNDRAKIGDFGFARPYIVPTEDGKKCMYGKFSTYLGTKPYVAPEVLSKTGVYDKKADLYSLGMILFEMFYKMTKSERPRLLGDLRKPDLELPKSLEENIKGIVGSLLQHEPSLRMPLDSVIDVIFKEKEDHTRKNDQRITAGRSVSIAPEKAEILYSRRKSLSRQNSDPVGHIEKSFHSMKFGKRIRNVSGNACLSTEKCEKK